jgi:predicted DNA binding CopG/RHH family protein
MVSKREHIPKNMTIEEASEFWDSHSVADYPSRVVKFEYRPEEQITFVAIANDLLRQLEKQAKKQGASIETLINLWIKEKLTA